MIIVNEFGTELLTEHRDDQSKTPLDYLQEASQPERLEELSAVYSSQLRSH